MKAIVEIPKGSIYKYELKHGVLILDRVLSIPYPANYGFIPNTLSEDGDELDIFVYSETPIHPLSQVKLEVLGVIEMLDGGVNDDKLICRLENSFHPVDNSFSQIIYFLRNYKVGTVMGDIGNKDKALQILEQAKVRFNTK